MSQTDQIETLCFICSLPMDNDHSQAHGSCMRASNPIMNMARILPVKRSIEEDSDIDSVDLTEKDDEDFGELLCKQEDIRSRKIAIELDRHAKEMHRIDVEHLNIVLELVATKY